MTPERWQQIKAVFEEADSAPTGDRAALLDRLCANDPDLRARVEQLLAEDESAAFIETAIASEAGSLLG